MSFKFNSMHSGEIISKNRKKSAIELQQIEIYLIVVDLCVNFHLMLLLLCRWWVVVLKFKTTFLFLLLQKNNIFPE